MTKESNIAETEEDSWGDVTIICTTCEEDRKCEECEEYFDDDEIVKPNRWTTYCKECYEEEYGD